MSSRDEVLKLIKQRDALESEIAELRSALDSQKVSAGESLVTEDGYPRSDIDVYAITHLRATLVRKHNDLKQLLQTISDKLPLAFAPKPANSESLGPDHPRAVGSGLGNEPLMYSQHAASHPLSTPKYTGPSPFAIVNTVVSGALGFQAGLAADDQIVKFGNATSLSSVSAEMQRHLNQDLEIVVLRNDTVHKIVVHLVPGRSLGAHIVPLTT